MKIYYHWVEATNKLLLTNLYQYEINFDQKVSCRRKLKVKNFKCLKTKFEARKNRSKTMHGV